MDSKIGGCLPRCFTRHSLFEILHFLTPLVLCWSNRSFSLLRRHGWWIFIESHILGKQIHVVGGLYSGNLVLLVRFGFVAIIPLSYFLNEFLLTQSVYQFNPHFSDYFRNSFFENFVQNHHTKNFFLRPKVVYLKGTILLETQQVTYHYTQVEFQELGFES